MAKDKKSFLLYCDLIHTVKKMPKEKAGKLFLIILEYVNDDNPVVDDMLLELVFEPIKQQFKRDLKKYESIVERNKSNGSKGGRPKKPKKPSGLNENPEEPKKADSDNDTDNDTGILNKEAFLELFNRARKAYNHKSNIKTLNYTDESNLRLLQTYSLEDFKTALHALLQNKWAIDNNQLMPSHFLKHDNFTKYLNTELKSNETLGQKLARQQ